MDVYSLKGYSVAELEKLLETYPWFPIVRKELFLKMSAMGEEYRRDTLHRTVLYLYPDYSVFREAYVLSSAAVVNEAEQLATEQVYELDLTGDLMHGPVEEEVSGMSEDVMSGPAEPGRSRRQP